MGLTKPRAHQLQDIDYKQTARAVTTSNITLSGGAPATVDGVSLALRDRLLVTGQSTGSENGIYYVTTVGAGSNGTWARSLDADTTGEVSAGMIIMVTEGTTYADTQWKLTTDDPITIGTTSLTFVRAGNAAYGTVAVSGEDSIVADAIGDTLTIVAGTNLALTTNASTDTLTITPSLTPSLTSVTATGNITGGNIVTSGSITDGTATVSSGSITGGVAATFSGNVTSANVTVGDVLRIANDGDGLRMTGVGAFDNAGSNIFRIFATNEMRISANGESGNAIFIDTSNNVTVNNDLAISGDATANNISVTNFVGSNLIPSANATYNLGSATNQWNEVHIAGSTLYLGDLQLKDSGGNTFTVFGSDGTTPAEVTGNIAGANVTGAVANATYADSSGTSATVTTAAQPNITSTGTLTSVTVSGNAIVGGNLTVSGNTVYTNVSTFSVQDPIIDLGRGANGAVLVSDDGKDRGTQLYYYSGSEKSAFVGYDNSEDKIILAKDVSISDEVVTVSTYGNTVVGGLEATTVEASGNIDAGNVNATSISGTLITAAQTNITSVGTLGSLSVTGNVSAGNLSGTNITGTLETASQTNITSVGTLGSLAVTGNVTAGNVIATIVGDVTGDVTGNVSGTAATVTTAAQPNITSVGTLTSVTTSGNISTDGNININDRQGLYLHDSDSSHYVALVPPATVTGNVTFTLPGDSGTADYVLATNGAGTLSWVEQSGGGSSGASSFPNSTVTPLPSSEGDFDLSYNYAQTTQETPFETGGTDAFGVSLGEVYSMMDPAGDIPDATDLGVLT